MSSFSCGCLCYCFMQATKFLLLLLLYLLDILLLIIDFLYSLLLYAPYIYFSSMVGKCARRNTASPKPSQTVLIIGYSFAGFELHKLLQSHRALQHLHFIVIEPKSYFEFTPSVLATMVHPDKYKSISFAMSQCFDPARSTLIQGKAVSIEQHSVTVHVLDTEETKQIKFDFCFICTGSKYAEPIKVNAYPVLTEQLQYNQRMQTFKDIYSRLNRQPDDEDGIHSLAIIGGGPVGVELMAEINQRFPDKQITILDANQHLCRLFPLSTQQYLEQYVQSHDNITLRLNTRIQQIITPSSSLRHSPHSRDTERSAGRQRKSLLIISQNMDIKQRENENENVSTYHLRVQQEEEQKIEQSRQETLEFDAVFKCAGFQPNSEILQNSRYQPLRQCLTEKFKFIKVDQHMRVHANVFALGDVIDQPHIEEIKLAHTAEIHARYLRDLMVFVSTTGHDQQNEHVVQSFTPYHEWLLGAAITERQEKRDGDKWKMPLVFTLSLGETDGTMGFGSILLNGWISRLFKWFIEISLCKLYQRKGICELNLCDRENNNQPIFRMYTPLYRIFSVAWWFSHHFTMWYIRHYNG